METQEHKPYSRRDIVIIIIILVVGGLVLGDLNTTTATVSSASAGPLSIAEYAQCSGFGAPTYYSSMDPDLNVTTYAYGHCYFGFWFPNGQPVGSTTTTGSSI